MIKSLTNNSCKVTFAENEKYHHHHSDYRFSSECHHSNILTTVTWNVKLGMATALFNFKGTYSPYCFVCMKLYGILCDFTCISQDALSHGIQSVVLEFLLDLNVQAAAAVPLDKAHLQMCHRLSLLCWDQMPNKKSVLPAFKIANTKSSFRYWCLSLAQHCQLKVQVVTSNPMKSVITSPNGKCNIKVPNILVKWSAIVLSASDDPT
jgi:hypothetical protein